MAKISGTKTNKKTKELFVEYFDKVKKNSKTNATNDEEIIIELLRRLAMQEKLIEKLQKQINGEK